MTTPTEARALEERVAIRRGTDQMRKLRGERPQDDPWPWIHEGELLEALRSLADQVEALEKDAERLVAIRTLCGYVEDGSCTCVQIEQDDATRDWIIRVGKSESFYGSSFTAAIDRAQEAT